MKNDIFYKTPSFYNHKRGKAERVAFLIKLGIGTVICTALVIGTFVFFKVNAVPDNILSPFSSEKPAASDANDSVVAEEDTGAVFTAKISWNDPEKIQDLGLYDTSSTNEEITGFPWESISHESQYYKVGKVEDGKYKDSEIVLLKTVHGDAGVAVTTWNLFYRFVRTGETLTLIARASDELYDGDGLVSSKFTIDKNFAIPELEFPKSITGPKPRQVLALDNSQEANVLFTAAKLQKSFTDEKLGDVYTTKGYPKNFSDIFSRHGFYLKAPDGTVRIYYAKPDFANENDIPKFSWTRDGENDAVYLNKDGTATCGDENYAAVVSSESLNLFLDLEPRGKTSQGDLIYELKDTHHQILKDLYGKGNFFGSEINYDDFLADHPVFFWIDPFGRYIKFIKLDYYPEGDCLG